ERDGLAIPGHSVARRVHLEMASLNDGTVRHGRDFLIAVRFALGRRTAKDRPDAGEQETLAEGLRDIVVRAHREAGFLVLLLVLAGQKDDRQIRGIPQAPKQLHAVHAWHLDVEYREVWRVLDQRLQGRFAIRIDAGRISLGLQRDRQRREDVAV